MNKTLKPGFHIRSEGRAERCEICHQADQFDPHSGVCGRCNALTVRPPTGLEVRNLNLPPPLRNLLQNELEGSEQLLWVGTPQVDKRIEIVSKLAVLLGLLGFCFALTLMDGPPNGGWFLLTSLGSIISCVFGGVLFLQELALRKQFYAVTNKRILLCSYGNAFRVQSFFKDQIKDLSRIQKLDGSGSIYYQGLFAFQRIQEVHEVEKLIRRYILQENKPH